MFGWTLKDSRLGVDWTLPFPSEFFSLLITADNHRSLTRVEFELSTFFLRLTSSIRLKTMNFTLILFDSENNVQLLCVCSQ